MILMDSISDLKFRKILQIVKSSSEILKYLVNDMLDLFSIKTNKFKKQEKPTNIRNEIAKEVLDIFIEPCKYKKLSLNFTVAE